MFNPLTQRFEYCSKQNISMHFRNHAELISKQVSPFLRNSAINFQNHGTTATSQALDALGSKKRFESVFCIRASLCYLLNSNTTGAHERPHDKYALIDMENSMNFSPLDSWRKINLHIRHLRCQDS